MKFRKNFIKLHFEHLQINNFSFIKFKPHQTKLGFIQYCINSDSQADSNTLFDQYLKENQPIIDTPETESQASLNRKKLKILYSHLSALSCNFFDLEIEPVCLTDLIEKFNDINKLSDEEVSAYLNKLIEKRIPAYNDLSLDEFLKKIEEHYQSDALNFHCYLRENFFKELEPTAIREPEPLLNYFMPQVFCQQHINSCIITTTLTNLKKVVANFKELQTVCFKDQPVSPHVQMAQEHIKELEMEFQSLLNNPSANNEKAYRSIYKNYLKNLQKIQIDLEKQLAPEFYTNKTPKLYIKKYKNFALSLIHHLFIKLTIPGGFLFSLEVWRVLKEKMSEFQSKILEKNFIISMEKAAVLEDVNQKNPSNYYLENLKVLFLSGQLKLESKSAFSEHSLLINIDEVGDLYFIEHKNGKPEKMLIARNVLELLGITSKSNAEFEALNVDIDSTLNNLQRERLYILKEKEIVDPTSEVYQELDKILQQKDIEIAEVFKIKHHLEEAFKPVENVQKFEPTRFFKNLIKKNDPNKELTPSSDSPKKA